MKAKDGRLHVTLYWLDEDKKPRVMPCDGITSDRKPYYVHATEAGHEDSTAQAVKLKKVHPHAEEKAFQKLLPKEAFAKLTRDKGGWPEERMQLKEMNDKPPKYSVERSAYG